jgi:chemotaxis protein MotB
MSANKVAAERYDIVRNKILASLESNTVTVDGGINVKEKRGEIDPAKLVGFIRIKISQKEITSDGRKPRKLEALFGEARVDMSVYDNFVNQVSNRKKSTKAPPASQGEALKKQVDDHLKEETGIKDPSSHSE